MLVASQQILLCVRNKRKIDKSSIMKVLPVTKDVVNFLQVVSDYYPMK